MEVTEKPCTEHGDRAPHNESDECMLCLAEQRAGEDREVGHVFEQARAGEKPSDHPVITTSPQNERAGHEF